MIKSRIPELDSFLTGGFSGGFITDISGPPGSGKTQLAFQICASAAAGGASVLFQDAVGEFRPERILDMLQKTDCHIKQPLDNIRVLRITNTGEQISGLLRIPGFSMVVIDGVTELFSFEYDRHGKNFEKNKIFMKYMRGLSKAAVDSSIPVIITNTVRTTATGEAEHLEKAIGLFTHLKISLTGRVDGSAARARLETVDKSLEFPFMIASDGLSSKPDS